MGRRPLLAALGIALGTVAIPLLLIPLFAGPASQVEPRDLPIVIAGPQAVQLSAAMEAARPGAFAITTVADTAAADRALRDREAYAALIPGRDALAVHTASAASPTVAALITAAAQQLAQGRPVQVTDVAPLPAGDPRGGGFAAGFFPLMISAMTAAIALFLVVPTIGARLAGMLVFSALAGAAGTAVLQTWLGVVGGDFLPLASVIALLVLAIGGSVLGLASLIGPPGIGLGAVLILLVGNALGGVAGAPELLPQPWGEVGQWLPIGAGATALRAVAWFGGAGGDSAIWTLAGWAGAGLLLLCLAWFKPGSTARSKRPEPDSPGGGDSGLGQAAVVGQAP